MAKRHQYAVMIFMLVGAALAVTIVHNNVVALTHASHPRPAEDLLMSEDAHAHVAHYRRVML